MVTEDFFETFGLLDLRREAEHAQDLGDPGAGEPLPAGDVGLGLGLPGGQEALPLLDLPEQLGHPGRSGYLGGLGLAPGRRQGAHHPVGGHPASQDADVAVFEGSVAPEGGRVGCGTRPQAPRRWGG